MKTVSLLPNFIIRSIVQNSKEIINLEKKIQNYIHEAENKTKSAIVFICDHDQIKFNKNILRINCIKSFNQFYKANYNKNISLILDVDGGNAYYSKYVFEHLNRHHYNIDTYVPYKALSAGTLISLGSKNIYANEFSLFSPIDFQLNLFNHEKITILEKFLNMFFSKKMIYKFGAFKLSLIKRQMWEMLQNKISLSTFNKIYLTHTHNYCFQPKELNKFGFNIKINNTPIENFDEIKRNNETNQNMINEMTILIDLIRTHEKMCEDECSKLIKNKNLPTWINNASIVITNKDGYDINIGTPYEFINYLNRTTECINITLDSYVCIENYALVICIFKILRNSERAYCISVYDRLRGENFKFSTISDELIDIFYMLIICQLTGNQINGITNKIPLSYNLLENTNGLADVTSIYDKINSNLQKLLENDAHDMKNY